MKFGGVQPTPVRPWTGMWAIGHRGYPTVAPENTLASFRAAIDAGVDMIELDVSLSSDDIPIVIHDDKLRRTTDGRGKVRKRTVADLEQLDAGSWFSPKFRGESLPLLSQVLELCSGKVVVNIEIKPEAVSKRDSLAERLVLDLIRRFGAEKTTVISSFSALAIRRVKELRPTQSAALLMPRVPKRSPEKVLAKVGADALHLPIRGLRPKYVQLALSQRIPIRVYTVNDPRRMKILRSWGVDGIFSDEAEVMVRTLRLEN